MKARKTAVEENENNETTFVKGWGGKHSSAPQKDPNEGEQVRRHIKLGPRTRYMGIYIDLSMINCEAIQRDNLKELSCL